MKTENKIVAVEADVNMSEVVKTAVGVEAEVMHIEQN
jgi:hypothetical protein